MMPLGHLLAVPQDQALVDLQGLVCQRQGAVSVGPGRPLEERRGRS